MKAVEYLPKAIGAALDAAGLTFELTGSSSISYAVPVFSGRRFPAGGALYVKNGRDTPPVTRKLTPAEALHGPSVLVKEEGLQWAGTLDGSAIPETVFFEIVARGNRDIDQARKMVDDILAKLLADGGLTYQLSRYDERSGADAERGRYFAHVLSIGLMGDGLPEVGAARG